MIKNFLAALLLGLVAFGSIHVGSVRADLAKPSSVVGELTPNEMRADFDLMRSALEEAHTGLYRYSTKPEMDRTFEAQRAKLDRPMKKTKFMALLSETTAAIHCGHTGVQPDEEMRDTLKNARTLPLQMMIEDGKLMVLLNETAEDQTIRPGMEITEINGHRVPEMLCARAAAIRDVLLDAHRSDERVHGESK